MRYRLTREKDGAFGRRVGLSWARFKKYRHLWRSFWFQAFSAFKILIIQGKFFLSYLSSDRDSKNSFLDVWNESYSSTNCFWGVWDEFQALKIHFGLLLKSFRVGKVPFSPLRMQKIHFKTFERSSSEKFIWSSLDDLQSSKIPFKAFEMNFGC